MNNATVRKATEVYRLRKKGFTLKEIGGALGCSQQNVRILIMKYERWRADSKTRNQFVKKVYETGPHRVAVRVINCLSNVFCVPPVDLDPIEVAKLGPRGLVKYKNFGRKSLRLVENTLLSLGVIEGATGSSWFMACDKHILEDEMLDGCWLRVPKYPRRYYKSLGPPPFSSETPKSKWVRQQTLQRFARSFPVTTHALTKCLRTGAFGQYSGFTIYETR